MYKFQILLPFVMLLLFGSGTQAENKPNDVISVMADAMLNNMHEKGLLKGMNDTEVNEMSDFATIVMTDMVRRLTKDSLSLSESSIDYNIFDDIKKAAASALRWSSKAAQDVFKWSEQATIVALRWGRRAAEDLHGYVKKYGPGFLKAMRDVTIVAGPIVAPILDAMAVSKGAPPGVTAQAINGVVAALRISANPQQVKLLTSSPNALSPEEQAEQEELIKKMAAITAASVDAFQQAQKGLKEKQAEEEEIREAEKAKAEERREAEKAKAEERSEAEVSEEE